MDVDRVILRIFKCAVHNADCSAAAGHLHKVSRTNAGSSASFIVAEIYIIQCNVFGKLSYHTKCMQKMQFDMLHRHTITLPEKGCGMITCSPSHLLTISCLEGWCRIVSHLQTMSVQFFHALYVVEKFIAGSSQGSGCHIKSLYMSDIVRIAPVCLSGVWADIAAPGNGCSAYGIIITFRNI